MGLFSSRTSCKMLSYIFSCMNSIQEKTMAFEDLVDEMNFFGIREFLLKEQVIPYPRGDEEYLGMVAGRCDHPDAENIAWMLVWHNVKPLTEPYGYGGFPACTDYWTEYHEFVSRNSLPIVKHLRHALPELWQRLNDAEDEYLF